MPLSYAKSVDYVYSLNRKRRIFLKFGFERMEAVLSEIGNPQDSLKFIHIAGTKGKGSVASFLSYIFSQKYKVGLFTSPSLVNTSERISINGALISPKEFSELVFYLKTIYRNLPEELIPTTFETFTIIAFLYFLKMGVDLSILEVGMGGRLDATNIIKSPLLSIIAPISFDHQKTLGNSLSLIAAEKAGIIKENIPVVVGKQKNEAEGNILKQARLKHSDIFLYGRDFYVKNIKTDVSGTTFDFVSTYSQTTLDNIKIPLIGIHQAENASVAIQSALLLEDITVSEKDIYLGLQKSFWPGRFEVVNKNPLIVLDGAHNDASAKALKDALNKFNKKHIVFLFSMLKDKNIDDVVRILSSENVFFVITEVPFSNRRRLDVNSLYRYVRKYLPEEKIIVEKDFRKAFWKAVKLIGKDDILCVTGSLYLVASVRKILNRFVFSMNLL